MARSFKVVMRDAQSREISVSADEVTVRSCECDGSTCDHATDYIEEVEIGEKQQQRVGLLRQLPPSTVPEAGEHIQANWPRDRME